MKKFALYLALLLTLAMLTACGGGSGGGDDSRTVLGGVGANAPIINGAVTITDINGNIIASDTTGANGAYNVYGGISASPFIVTISATPTSTFANGYPFKGEIKGLFTSGDPVGNLNVTVPSTILYKIWDAMGRPTDITAARSRATAFLQMLGINTGSVGSLWTTNPVGLDYEIINQQLVFLCGQDDAAGATDIFTRASNLANAYMTVPNPLSGGATSVRGLIQTYTGYNVNSGGGGDQTNFADLWAQTAIIKSTIASAVKAGLTGTSAASSASNTDTVLSQLDTHANAAAAYKKYPGYITLSGAGGITNAVTTKVISFGAGTTNVAVQIDATTVDGTAASAGTLSIQSMSSSLTADQTVGTGFNTATTVTFTVNNYHTGTHQVTLAYTETASGSPTMTTTFYIKVLGSGEVYASGAAFDANDPERILFVDATNTTKVATASEYSTAGTTGATFDASGAGEFIAAFYLPDGMYFVDSNNKFWPNWDVTVTAGGAGSQSAALPASKTVKANSDLSYGEYTWTFRVFDVNRDQLQTSVSGTGIVYGTGGANAIRQITNEDYDLGGTNYKTITYGSNADGTNNIQFDGGTTGNQYIKLGAYNSGKFEAAIQTWAHAAGDSTATGVITTGNFYLNVKSSNFDDYAGKKTFGFTSSGNQNHDVTASNLAWDATNKWVTFDIDVNASQVDFYPDYGVGLSNIDKIRIGYENTGGTKAAGDVKSDGTTFSYK